MVDFNKLTSNINDAFPIITDFDCFIQSQYEYIFNIRKQKFYNKEMIGDINFLINTEKSTVLKRRYKKWYLMSYTQKYMDQLLKIPEEKIFNAVKKYSLSNKEKINLPYEIVSSYNIDFTLNEPINDDQGCFHSRINSLATPKKIIDLYHLSQNTESLCETGLRNYYIKHTKHFRERVLKGPPDTYRILSWMICLNIPLDRDKKYYNDLLEYSLKSKVINQIDKDAPRAMKGKEAKFEYSDTKIDLIKPITRILKSIALLDNELSYCQGMNFISGFLLSISDINELQVFYLMLSLFSSTFNNNHNLRTVFIEGFPKLMFLTYVFRIKIQKHLNKLCEKFTENDIQIDYYPMKWIELVFIHFAPKNFLLRIWDLFIVKGCKILVSISVSIFDILEKKLLECEDLQSVGEIFDDFFLNSDKHIDKIIDLSLSKYKISRKDYMNYLESYKNESEENYEKIKNENLVYEYMNPKIEENNECLKDLVPKLKKCKKYTKKKSTLENSKIEVTKEDDIDIPSNLVIVINRKDCVNSGISRYSSQSDNDISSFCDVQDINNEGPILDKSIIGKDKIVKINRPGVITNNPFQKFK